jgi:hypothetical protein
MWGWCSSPLHNDAVAAAAILTAIAHDAAAVGMVEHMHNMRSFLDQLPEPLQRELETFKKAIKKATMGDRCARRAPVIDYRNSTGA